MWLAEQLAISGMEAREQAAAGEVSIGGRNPAVVTDAERREGQVLCPGGYAWSARVGQKAVVLGGGQTLVAGVLEAPPVALAPGEVCIYAPGGARIVLKNTGRIELTGEVYLNGVKVEGLTCTQNG